MILYDDIVEESTDKSFKDLEFLWKERVIEYLYDKYEIPILNIIKLMDYMMDNNTIDYDEIFIKMEEFIKLNIKLGIKIGK